MPELPEVETVVCDLRAAGLVGARITGARVFWPRSIAVPAPDRFSAAIRGLNILGLSRRGKFIQIELAHEYVLLAHLRMTGRLHLAAHDDLAPPPPHARVLLWLDDGRALVFSDPRKFGRLWLTSSPANVLGDLGPEPLSTPPDAFTNRLASRSRALKPLLLDQSFLAGIGNIYADETLWTARLHPLRRSDSLSPAEARTLFRAIQTVLRRGIRNLGTSLGSGKTNFHLPRGEPGRNREHLRAYGQTGRPCPRCRRPIVRLLVAQRATHICPACQHLFPG